MEAAMAHNRLSLPQRMLDDLANLTFNRMVFTLHPPRFVPITGSQSEQEETMKPLTADTLAKAAIIEGYCWEASIAEASNKNRRAAEFFMRTADSIREFCQEGHDPEGGGPEHSLSAIDRLTVEDIRKARDCLTHPEEA